MSANAIAQRFHEAYERLAPEYGYETRRESAVPWEEVPEKNRALMEAVVRETGMEELLEAAKELMRDGHESRDNPMLYLASSADADDLAAAVRRVEAGQ